MEKIQLTAEVVTEISEIATPNEIRTLQDVELLLAGGGSDGGVIWG
jgi:hypothetical protein